MFPRTYEQTRDAWVDGSIVLVAGRVDHRGEEVQVLADLVRSWDEVQEMGEERFAAEVAAGDRGRSRGQGDRMALARR